MIGWVLADNKGSVFWHCCNCWEKKKNCLHLLHVALITLALLLCYVRLEKKTNDLKKQRKKAKLRQVTNECFGLELAQCK